MKFTLERVATDETLQNHQNYNQIQSVEVIDDHTFRIHTVGPEPVLLNRVSRTSSGILPKDYIEENGWDHFMENPVGSGPYQYSDWIRDDRVILDAFEDYYDGRVGEWDTVEFRTIPETSTRIAEILTGGVDIASNIPPADWDRVNENEGTSIVDGPSNVVYQLVVNQQEEYPTSDLRVRQAIDLAINNQGLIDAIMSGQGTPTKTHMNPGNFGANEELYDSYNFDLDEARALMSEAGYEDGFTMTLHSSDGVHLNDRETIEIVAGMLSEINIDVELDFLEWSSYVDLRRSYSHQDMYFLGMSVSLFDSAQGLAHYHSNNTEPDVGYVSEEIDELLGAAQINLDLDEREQQYKRIQEIINEDIPRIYLFNPENFYAVSDGVHFETRLDEAFRLDLIEMK